MIEEVEEAVKQANLPSYTSQEYELLPFSGSFRLTLSIHFLLCNSKKGVNNHI